MKKIYYPDLKQKKECMTKLVKKAPEYKGIKIAIWILAVLCPIAGATILVCLMLSPNYWTLVNEGPGNFYIFIATMLLVMCPGFALATWNKRFYTCCGEVYMNKYLQFEQTEEEIRIVYHIPDSYETACGDKQDKDPNTMHTTTYPYEIIRGIRYEADTHLLEVTGAVVLEKYWDYEKGIKDESPRWLRYDDTKMIFLLCFDERNEFLDYLYEKIKDTVWEPIEVTWDSKVELSEWEE